MSTPPDAPARTLQRDRPDSAFSHILNRFVQVHLEVLAAVVVDCDGECVDYASVIDPYEAKVFGAALLGTTAEITAATRRMGAGSPIQWIVEAAHYDLLVRRLSDPLARFLADVFEPVQRPRDGRDRNIGLAGDIADGGLGHGVPYRQCRA